jgi:iron-sulfur cluster assembly accessory protein
MIKVTLKAEIFIQLACEQENKKYCFLSVLAGGCSGFKYSVLFTDTVIKDSTLIKSNILVDNYSISLLGDCIINLKEELGFKQLTFENPIAKSSCSCGKSFAV